MTKLRPVFIIIMIPTSVSESKDNVHATTKERAIRRMIPVAPIFPLSI